MLNSRHLDAARNSIKEHIDFVERILSDMVVCESLESEIDSLIHEVEFFRGVYSLIDIAKLSPKGLQKRE